MPVSDRLWEAFVQAKSQPSRAYRDFEGAINAVQAPIQGYMQTKDSLLAAQERKAKVLDSFGNLVDKVGYNKAATLFGPVLNAHGIKPQEAMAFKVQPSVPQVASASMNQPLMADAGTPDTGNANIPSVTTPENATANTSAPAISATPGEDYGSEVNYALQNPNDVGKGGLARLQTLTNLQQNRPASFDEVRSFFTSAKAPEIGESLIASAQKAGHSSVPKDMFDKATSLVGPRSDIASALNRRTDLQIANAINHNVNAFVSNNSLGQAGRNNLRVARIKPLLEKDGPLTPQELNLVQTDINGIVSGGVPLKDTEEGQRIETFQTQIANLYRRFGNTPAVFNDSEFRKRMIPLVNGMINADNQVQEKAFNMVAANYGHLTTPEHLKRVHDAILAGEQLPVVDIQGGGTPGYEVPGGGTGDAEADKAIQMIMGSQLSESAKNARIRAVRARSGSARSQ